jgi:hypothetical protein
MTWIEVEGFEVYGDDGTAAADVETALVKRNNFTIAASGTTNKPVLIAGEDQGYALRMPATSAGQWYTWRWEFPSAYQVTLNGSVPEFVVGFRLRSTSVDGVDGKAIWRFKQSSGSSLIQLRLANDGADLQWDDGETTHTIASCLTADAWQYVELIFKPTSAGANGGYITIKVDGIEVWSDADRTLAAAFYTAWGMEFYQDQSMPGDSSDYIGIDDVCFYELDGADHTAELGNRLIVRLVPTSDATPNDWTPSTGGDNYALIDEVELDEADYVDGATTADDDHYGLTTLGSYDSVDCMQIDCECDAVDGTPTVHIGFDDGTADEDDDGVISTGANTIVRKLFADDPSGSAWTTSSVNSVEATQRMTE